jgi:hypothetical protein
MNLQEKIQKMIGRWFSRRTLSRKEDTRRPHLISTATVDEKGNIDAITFCGIHLKNPVGLDTLGPWDPEDHLDIVCPDCLKWYRDMKPKPTEKGFGT